MINNLNELVFNVKLASKVDWTVITIALSDLKRNDFTCDESLSILIMEYVYAENEEFYVNEDDLVYEVANYWDDIIISTHKVLYPMKYI